MKHVSAVIPGDLSVRREEKEESISLDPLCGQLVEKIFVKIALICRGFDSFYADRNRLNAEKTQWVIAFSKLGIKSKTQIMGCLSRLEQYQFPNPPQLGEFLSWRTSLDNTGLPEFEEAYKISIEMNKQFSDYIHHCVKTHTVIKHAIRQIGGREYREMTKNNARKAFAYQYAVSCRLFIDGQFEVTKPAIESTPAPHPSDKERNEKARAKAMESMRSILNAN